MEECFTLKYKIKKLIQVGHLWRFIRRGEGGFSYKRNEWEGRDEGRARIRSENMERCKDGIRRKVQD